MRRYRLVATRISCGSLARSAARHFTPHPSTLNPIARAIRQDSRNIRSSQPLGRSGGNSARDRGHARRTPFVRCGRISRSTKSAVRGDRLPQPPAPTASRSAARGPPAAAVGEGGAPRWGEVGSVAARVEDERKNGENGDGVTRRSRHHRFEEPTNYSCSNLRRNRSSIRDEKPPPDFLPPCDLRGFDPPDPPGEPSPSGTAAR